MWSRAGSKGSAEGSETGFPVACGSGPDLSPEKTRKAGGRMAQASLVPGPEEGTGLRAGWVPCG